MMDSALTLAVFVALAFGVALVSILFYILIANQTNHRHRPGRR
jgi:hypothetical protein